MRPTCTTTIGVASRTMARMSFPVGTSTRTLTLESLRISSSPSRGRTLEVIVRTNRAQRLPHGAIDHMQEHHVTVRRTARYYTLGPTESEVAQVWIVCHGFAQLAGRFMRHFAPLDDGTR